MEKTHLFNTSKEALFNVIESALKDEVEHITNTRYENLENVKYNQERNGHSLQYHISKCNAEDGYHVTINDGLNVQYEMSIELESLSEHQTKMIYTNKYDSKKTSRVLNYHFVSFIFKRKINKRYKNLVRYIEYKLKEKK